MTQMGASFGAGALADDEVTAQALVAVYNCSRIGRVANPPRPWFIELFRSARRR